ncbi:MAG: peptide chain release factor N(5)-glutamine methyltransferase [Eubacterium sp.]|nr:peptide chain release factor N(5)-glutamine methyltransferase [Eubacterium sp.]
MNVKEAYDYSFSFLKANGVDEAENKALNAVCCIAGIKLGEYQSHKDDFVNMKRLADFLWRLKTGEPLQYVIGKWDFYESEFFVGEGVLIPRPETEELTELVIDYAKSLEKPVIFDLCSGSGCIGISVAKKLSNAFVYCIEKSKDAYKYLKRNAKDVANVKCILGDINNEFDLPSADIIVSNPPYIKSGDMKTLQKEVKKEPSMALDGGEDGLDFYRIINDKWKKYLKDNGRLFLEIGEDEGESIKDALSAFSNITVKKDLSGNDRMVVADKVIG